MIKFKHILFPVDFSGQCAKATPFVQAWAAHFGARVSLLNVLEMPPAYYTDSTAFIAAANIEELLQLRKEQLESFTPKSFRNPDDRRIVTSGIAAMTILDFVTREGVDLIMMPTRGYGPFRRFLLGSVTAKVLHDCACPVWTGVHAEQPATAWSPPDCRSVLCAIDLAPKSAGVIRWAKDLADSYSAKLVLLHTITGWPESEPIPQADQFRALVFDFARKEIEKLQQQAGTNVEVRIVGGEVAHVVHRTAFELNSDLVVIGRGVLQEPFGRLRTNAYAIIRESPCPVLSV